MEIHSGLLEMFRAYRKLGLQRGLNGRSVALRMCVGGIGETMGIKRSR